MYVCVVIHFLLEMVHACFVSEVGSCQIPLFHPYFVFLFAFERTTHWARRREILFGILMGFSWENCPQNRPLHRCLCFRSAVLRVREGVRYNPVWRNLKYTSNFCFDVSLRTLEVERFFFLFHTEHCFYYTIKSTGTATFIMSHSSVSTLQP